MKTTEIFVRAQGKKILERGPSEPARKPGRKVAIVKWFRCDVQVLLLLCPHTTMEDGETTHLTPVTLESRCTPSKRVWSSYGPSDMMRGPSEDGASVANTRRAIVNG